MEDIIALNYSIDKVDVLANDDRFCKVRIHAFGDGENAHTKPVSLDNLKKTANTIYNIPIVVQFTNYNYDKIGTHSDDEVPVGFVYTNDNPISFEYDENKDKTFLTVNGLLWTKYTNNIVDIIRKSNGTKKVSVEMRINKSERDVYGGKPDILDWTYYAITILSDEVREACKGSDIQLVQFSKDKSDFINLKFSENGDAKVEDNKTEQQKVDEAVVSASGYPLSEDDSVENTLSEMDASKVINEAENVSVVEESEDMSNDSNAEDEVVEEAEDEKELVTEAESENDKDSDDSGDNSNDEKDDGNKKDNDEDMEKQGCNPDEAEMSLDVAMAKIAELSAELDKQKQDNKAYMAQLEKMSDYDELKQYKVNMEEKIRHDEKMSEISLVMSQICDKNNSITESDKTYLMSKVDEYQNVTEWSNMAKAYVFDKYNTTDSVEKIGMPFASKKTFGSVWSRI